MPCFERVLPARGLVPRFGRPKLLETEIEFVVGGGDVQCGW